jgi:hypothetical protein
MLMVAASRSREISPVIQAKSFAITMDEEIIFFDNCQLIIRKIILAVGRMLKVQPGAS